MPSKEKMEKKALKIIMDAGEEGVFQSELWRLLNVSSREGSRLSKKFEEKGKIIREKVLHNGRWTYKLYYRRAPVTLESIEGCPCLICPDIDKCFGGGNFDPNTCLQLTAWIDSEIKQKE